MTWPASSKRKYNNPEQQIKNQILLWLNYQNNGFFWPNNSMGVFDPVKKFYRKPGGKFNVNGTADILGAWLGWPVAIEIKSEKGKQSEDQRLFQIRFEEAGGIYILARSLDDVIKVLTSLTKRTSLALK